MGIFFLLGHLRISRGEGAAAQQGEPTQEQGDGAPTEPHYDPRVDQTAPRLRQETHDEHQAGDPAAEDPRGEQGARLGMEEAHDKQGREEHAE